MKAIIHFILLCFSIHSSYTLSSEKLVDSFILQNVNIVDVESRQIIPKQYLEISHGKILKISGSPITNTDNVKVLEGHNGYITPGLIDMHVHMYEEAAYVIALSHGVTHVRIMNGLPDQLVWRDKIASGDMIGATSTVSSPIISAYDQMLHHTALTPEDATNAVKTYKEMGYDLIKVYGNLSEPTLAALSLAGKQHNIPLAKHGPHTSGDMPLSQLRHFQSFEHVEEIFQTSLNFSFDFAALEPLIQDIKNTNVPIVPTLNIFHQLTEISTKKDSFLAKNRDDYSSRIIAFEASHNQVDRWLNASDEMAKFNQKAFSHLLKITKQLHNQGVELLVGSDSGVLLSPHGLATHNEIELLGRAGLSAYDVLAAATINAAKTLNLDNKIGKIASGFQADFIYSRLNPVLDITTLKNPDAVIKLGHWYDNKSLLKLREDAINNRSIWQELKTIASGL